ncbi:MAG: DUF393 domain-containing protein [Chitinophagaceae bacterium]|nr:MAG: DUF393 domain-containing protein [Chitinophagaceae bacterium]
MEDHPIILFDGVCNYCNSWVNFAIRNDKKAVLRFAPLQSSIGQRLIKKYDVSPELDTGVMIDKGKTYIYSDAALHMARYLKWPAKILSVLIIFPGFIRHPVYKWIARNRYKWFGKKETCMVPTAEVRDRFLL